MNLALVVLATVLSLTHQPIFAARASRNCTTALKSVAKTAALSKTPGSWRSAQTRVSPNGLLATNKSREAEIKESVEGMVDLITNEDTTPEMEFYEIPGVKKTDITPNNSGIERIQVSGAGVKDGILRGTLLLPVSGHLGKASADKWKKTDTYSIILTDSKGKDKALVKDVKSLDYVTLQELEIPLKANEQISINYFRSGSGGPSGFPEGRIIEIVWKTSP